MPECAHENYFTLIEKVIILKKSCAARFGYQLLIEQEFLKELSAIYHC